MMFKRKKGLIWGAIILILVGFIFYRIADKFAKPKPVISESTTPVEVETAKLGSITNQLILTGNVEPEETVVLSPKRSNKIAAIYAKENQRITLGQVLIRLDSDDLNAQLNQNYAQVAANKATANQIKVQMDNAATDLHRNQNLYNQGAISQQQLDSARTQYNALAAQYKAALAQTQATNSGASYVSALVSDNTIKAPFNGVVISKSAENGEVVDGGKPILTVAKVDQMKVKANVSEMDVSKIKIGQMVKVTVDALPGETFQGKVKQILPEVDVQSRSLIAEIIIDNPQFEIKPNMFSRCYINTAHNNNAIVIKKQAVIYRDNQPYVYLAIGKKARLVSVTLGITQNDLVQIVKGVEPGDQIITLGQNVIDDNASIEVRKVGD